LAVLLVAAASQRLLSKLKRYLGCGHSGATRHSNAAVLHQEPGSHNRTPIGQEIRAQSLRHSQSLRHIRNRCTILG
jgi:hypothetical protein